MLADLVNHVEHYWVFYALVGPELLFLVCLPIYWIGVLAYFAGHRLVTGEWPD